MPNKSLSLLSVLLLSAACVVLPAVAQEQVKAVSDKANPAEETVAPKTDGSVVKQAVEEQVIEEENVPAQETKEPKEFDAPKVLDDASRQLLEQELGDVSTESKDVVDFPARQSLGELELAPLPGINEQLITGPASMEPSVSPKDLPSEQLLGRITTEVFQEMADLERGNIFLKLQTQKEQLKNDLEKLKATYRQARLDEISKREDVVRSRIAWWQEQEKLRLETEKKKQEEAELEQKIAEAEAMRDQLRTEALEKANANPDDINTQVNVDSEKSSAIFADLYTISSIKGIGGKLTAQIRDLSNDAVLVVKVDDTLPSGHVVKKITKDSMFVVYEDQESSLTLTPTKKTTDTEDEE